MKTTFLIAYQVHIKYKIPSIFLFPWYIQFQKADFFQKDPDKETPKPVQP